MLWPSCEYPDKKPSTLSWKSDFDLKAALPFFRPIRVIQGFLVLCVYCGLFYVANVLVLGPEPANVFAERAWIILTAYPGAYALFAFGLIVAKMDKETYRWNHKSIRGSQRTLHLDTIKHFMLSSNSAENANSVHIWSRTDPRPFAMPFPQDPILRSEVLLRLRNSFPEIPYNPDEVNGYDPATSTLLKLLIEWTSWQIMLTFSASLLLGPSRVCFLVVVFFSVVSPVTWHLRCLVLDKPLGHSTPWVFAVFWSGYSCVLGWPYLALFCYANTL